MAERPVIVWFRQDLRLSDHPALAAALASGQPVIFLYVLDDETPSLWAMGGASRWWLHGSLERLGTSIEVLGAKLVLRRGRSLDMVAEVVREAKASAVYFTRAYEPYARDLEVALKGALSAEGVECKRYPGALLHEPDQLQTQQGGPYRVYSPFWRALSGTVVVGAPLGAPERIPASKAKIKSDTLKSWALLPTKPDWAPGFREMWAPGEVGAHERLAGFLDRALATYAEDRNRPDIEGTSRLSPHLHFGEISPRQCWTAARHAAASRKGADKGLETFLKELCWREFSYHLLFHYPTLPTEPYRPEFAAFPWLDDAAALKRWQKGQTGFPIVDAGMRELWATGYMHNRVRMIVASFLIKDLMVPWQAGEAWFWDTLVDADLANNAASWQWVAGCGADAAPYFRIFNPITQGEKFDPNGDYVRRWVPELQALPKEVIHAPWTAPALVLHAAGVRLGETYPMPMVDHGTQRDLALGAFEKIKKAS